jgi:hypothetical protein
MRRLLGIVLALGITLPGCPVPGSLRGIGTGNKPPPTSATPSPSGRYVYACADATRPEMPELLTRANDREGAIDRCLTELRARSGSGASLSCRCRLEGNAELFPGVI